MGYPQENFKWFLSGFTAGEGSFFCTNLPSVQFEIQLKKDDDKILLKIKDFLGCGRIYISDKKRCMKFRVTKLKDLTDIIIPLFNEHHFFNTKKQLAYDKWKIIVNLIVEKKHHNSTGKELIKLLAKGVN